MGEKMLVLSWKYHNVTFSNIISKFRGKGNYSDVTVACEGRFYPAHKLVLAACSEYFEDMFQHTACKHPIIVLKDITAKNLEALLSYMYSGVANISQDDLASLIRAAESLCIKGLAVPDDSVKDPTEAAASTSTTSTVTAAAAKTRRKKRECNTDIAASQGGDYSEAEESSTREWQEALGAAEKMRGSGNSGSSSEPPPPLPAASPTHKNAGALESTPDMPFKSPVDDVVVKEELPENSPSLCYDGQLDCALDELTPTTTTGLAGGMEANSQSQSYLCPMEAGGGTITDFQHQQQQQQYHQQQLQQHPIEAGMAGSSGISQSLQENDGCYDAFPSLDGLNCEGQMELYSQFNLQGPQFTLPQLSMEGSRTGRTPKLVSGTGRGNKPRSIKVHRCPHCSYSTPWHSVFVRHCRTHSGEKPFTCSFCPFRSSRKSVIKRHCLSKHT